MRQRSITGPLILVGIGVLFLINNLWRDVAVWSLFADYWPVLLIIMGVIGLVEVLIHASRNTAPPPRPVTGGGFFWIFVIVMFAIWGSNRGGIHIGRLNSSGVSILGSDYDFDINASSPSQGITRVVLENLKGNLSLKGEETSEVKLSGRKSIRAFNKGDAERADQQSVVKLDRQGDLLIVRAEEPRNSRMLSVSIDLDLVVPKGVSIEIRTRNGDISLSAPEKAGFDLDGLTAQGEASNDFGSPLDQKSDGRGATIKGKTGAGPQVILNTDRGTLTVKNN